VHCSRRADHSGMFTTLFHDLVKPADLTSV
jgi:hypothetical protein